MKYYLGIDIGSVSVKYALIDDNNEIIKTEYKRHMGKTAQAAMDILEELHKEFHLSQLANTVITGVSASTNGKYSPVKTENEIICQAHAAGLLYPDVKSVIEIGGQDSKLINLFFDNETSKMVIRDFAMNTICAAGTGSFLDQQANRLNVNIEEEFGDLALKSEKPPRIAGRCSVFAKTDMIHLQQAATPVHDIVAGLCYAVARNFVSSIARGKQIETPVAFQGGVASNKGMIRAFWDILELDEDDLRIHPHHKVMGAIGAALTAKENAAKDNHIFDFESLVKYFRKTHHPVQTLNPLKIKLSKTSTSPERGYLPRGKEQFDAFLGIDVGSISTNLVAIDENGKVVSKRYLRTAGRPIEAVQQGLREIGEEISERATIKGVCTTGSGRYLTGDFFGADVIKNEITAQATAAAAIDPKVDTIFEIGGQDSKYISMENGVIVDFEMNKVCAAGTGSFLEEQAEKLGINIQREFANHALSAKNPCAMGDRCTVFIETDLVANQQKGAKIEDLVAGLGYSIAYNYLNKVVGDRKIGDRIFFQGGTAYNDSVVAAFEAITGKRIYVPDHHEVTGAIGCAIIARNWYNETGGETRFKGFDRSGTVYEQDSFECRSCSNHCEINRVEVDGEEPLIYGGRCEKFEVKRRTGENPIPDLFVEREEFLLREYKSQSDRVAYKGTVGIPRMMYSFELLPFWVRLFRELRYKVVLSDPTNKEIVNTGLEQVLAESCFPVKVAHGHVSNLMKKQVDYLFLPSVIDFQKDYEKFDETAACPYGQALPYILRAALDLDRQKKVKLLMPVFHFSKGKEGVIKQLKSIASDLGINKKVLKRAVENAYQAQDEFYASVAKRGKEILADLKEEDNAIVIISRPYNGCDSGVNLELPKKLRDLDCLPIPMDFLPLKEVPIDQDWPFMTWRTGQKFLAAADIIRDNPNLNAMFITNFGCGPDSFLMKFFRKRMGGKVYLQIEIDEHSADVGAITRCEAFKDSIENIRKKQPEKFTLTIRSMGEDKNRRTLYIPNMCDGAYAIKSAFIANGIPAEVLPPTDLESLYWARKFNTGKECYPCIVTSGDMIKLTKKKDFNRDRVAFFMPSAGGGCRFGYYNVLQRIILDELGYPDIPIYSPHQTGNLLEDLGSNVSKDFFRQAWGGMVAVDLLQKALQETRPYENTKGETDRAYQEYTKRTCNAILKGQDVLPVMQEARHAFERIAVDREQVKPVIGIVGEIFVRLNRFSNNNIAEALEKLGAEVWIAPFFEWIFYINMINKEDRLEERDMLGYAKLFIEDKVAKSDEMKLVRAWDGFLRSAHEPSAEENVKAGSAYVDPSFRGETILSLGKAVDFYRSGLSGVINVMPFTCMPGTVVNSMLKRVREDCEDIPILNVAYDGLDMNNDILRLETFVHQCKQYMHKKVLAEMY
jgi:predicted CoA-substrate-specific enzyme activase